MPILVAALLGAAALPAPAGAARTDAQAWPALFVTGLLGGGFRASFEAINRVTDDVGRLGQLELRFQTGHRVSPAVTL